VAAVVSPFRFCKRQPFWSCCGLGIVMRSSAARRAQGLNQIGAETTWSPSLWVATANT